MLSLTVGQSLSLVFPHEPLAGMKFLAVAVTRVDCDTYAN
jgi:hypothetical protein